MTAVQAIHLQKLDSINSLTLNAPRLQKVKIVNCSLQLDFVHPESVESIAIDQTVFFKVENLKNLKYLYCKSSSRINSKLTSLKNLKEVHLNSAANVSRLLQRRDLKIFYFGCLLNGPDDPAIASVSNSNEKTIVYLSENARLSDEIPLFDRPAYRAIEAVAPELTAQVLNRFTDLKAIQVDQSVQDTERFLNLLKNFKIVELNFFGGQSQDLFNRLPDHVQSLTISRATPDLAFLFELKRLMQLSLDRSISAEFIKKIFEELPFLSRFVFIYQSQNATIQVDYRKRFLFSILKNSKWPERQFANLKAMIKFIKERI